MQFLAGIMQPIALPGNNLPKDFKKTIAVYMKKLLPREAAYELGAIETRALFNCSQIVSCSHSYNQPAFLITHRGKALAYLEGKPT